MHLLILLPLALLATDPGSGMPAALPDDLADLPALVGDEQGLLDHVRTFDLAQRALAEADLERAAQGPQEAAEAKRQEALRRYRLIARAYEFVLEHFPKNARACNYYGELLYDLFGEHDRAVDLWNMATLYDPKLSSPFNNLGIHYCHAGEYARGLKCYQAALELDPNNSDYLFNLAQTCLVNRTQMQALLHCDAHELYKNAMKLSRKAVQNAPDDFSLLEDYALNFYAAEEFDVKPDWSGAAKAWRQAREHAPNDAARFNTWLNEARVWIRRGSDNKARDCLERALAIRPDSAIARQLLDALEARTK